MNGPYGLLINGEVVAGDGERLAVENPFTEEDAATLKTVCPLFAVALAGIVRGEDDEEAESDGGSMLDEEKREKPKKDEKKKKDDADWWKRGEEPPF